LGEAQPANIDIEFPSVSDFILNFLTLFRSFQLYCSFTIGYAQLSALQITVPRTPEKQLKLATKSSMAANGSGKKCK